MPTQATPAAKPARPAKGTGVVSYEVEYLDELDEDEFPSVVPANRIRCEPAPFTPIGAPTSTPPGCLSNDPLLWQARLCLLFF